MWAPTTRQNTDVLNLSFRNLCFKAQGNCYLYGYLLLQHHGSSMLGHRQLIILCHAWRGQPRGLQAHVDARRRRASGHHSHRWNHAHTRRHGWHGHLRHGRHPWHLDGWEVNLQLGLSQEIPFSQSSFFLWILFSCVHLPVSSLNYPRLVFQWGCQSAQSRHRGNNICNGRCLPPWLINKGWWITKRYIPEKAYLPASCTPSAGQSAPPWDLRSIQINTA